MYTIGLTGGIASGKSTAAEALRAMGAQVIDADAISRAVTAPGGAAAPQILDAFGTLNRRTLAGIVFSDPEALQRLNAIVHPVVQAQMEAEIAASSAPIVVLDVPLLYEANMAWMVNEVWVVHVPRDTQVQRVMARDGLSAAEAAARIDSQMPTEEKLRRADVAIDTSGTFEQTRAQLRANWESALAKATRTDAVTRAPAPPPRRRRQAASVRQDAPAPQEDGGRVLPFRPPVRPRPQPRRADAWEDTSTLLEIPEQRTFLAKQPPIFWVAAALLLVALLTVAGIVGVGQWREIQAERAEAQRLAQLAEEKARYRFDYRGLIEQYSAERGLDPALVAAVIYNESRFDPQATSYKDACGLMQIVPATGGWIAERLGELDSYTQERLYEPELSIRYGTWYLSYLLRLFDGNWVNAIAGYHAGQGSVQGWLKNSEYSADGVTLKSIPFPDTEQYVQRVVDTYAMYIKHYYTEEAAPAA